jgi:hypothetical protein
MRVLVRLRYCEVQKFRGLGTVGTIRTLGTLVRLRLCLSRNITAGSGLLPKIILLYQAEPDYIYSAKALP